MRFVSWRNHRRFAQGLARGYSRMRQGTRHGTLCRLCRALELRDALVHCIFLRCSSGHSQAHRAPSYVLPRCRGQNLKDWVSAHACKRLVPCAYLACRREGVSPCQSLTWSPHPTHTARLALKQLEVVILKSRAGLPSVLRFLAQSPTICSRTGSRALSHAPRNQAWDLMQSLPST